MLNGGAKEIGVHPKTLQRWVKVRRNQLDGKVPPKQESTDVKNYRSASADSSRRTSP